MFFSSRFFEVKVIVRLFKIAPDYKRRLKNRRNLVEMIQNKLLIRSFIS